jgi:hypothetical protein
LAVIHQHFCSINLLIRIIVSYSLLTLDAQCADSSNDYVFDVFINVDLCGCVSTPCKSHKLLALDVFLN